MPWSVMGSPGSRTRHPLMAKGVLFELSSVTRSTDACRSSTRQGTRCLRACSGSSTARGSHASCGSDAYDVAFRVRPRRRHPEVDLRFRGSIPGLHILLSTLRTHGYPCLRMTRSCCDSLCLQHMELSSTTPCRFVPAHGRHNEKSGVLLDRMLVPKPHSKRRSR